MVLNRFPHHHERGAALVELALLIPVIVLLVSAIIDLSSTVRMKRIAIETTRQSARISARAQDLGNADPLLGDEFGLLPEAPCSSYLTTYASMVPRSLTSYTKLVACQQLEQVSDSVDAWEVAVIVNQQAVLEDGAPDFDMHQIQVQIDRTVAACTFCLGIASSFLPSSKSTFYTRVT